MTINFCSRAEKFLEEEKHLNKLAKRLILYLMDRGIKPEYYMETTAEDISSRIPYSKERVLECLDFLEEYGFVERSQLLGDNRERWTISGNGKVVHYYHENELRENEPINWEDFKKEVVAFLIPPNNIWQRKS